jgi:hypothetical protein
MLLQTPVDSSASLNCSDFPAADEESLEHLIPGVAFGSRIDPVRLGAKLTRCREVKTLDFRITRVYPKVSGLAAWNENCLWYSSLSLGAVISLFCGSV